MKSIEIKSDENVVCPFCQQITVEINSEDPEVIPCSHLVYAATDVSLEFRSEIINRLFGIDSQEENCELTLSDLMDHPEFENIFNDGELKDLIQYESYDPAPSFMGAYYGYIQK
jgi:hypothetical protein